MTYEEILQKAKEFENIDVARTYTVLALFNEWQKETGGTVEEYLDYMEKSFAKKKGCRA